MEKEIKYYCPELDEALTEEEVVDGLSEVGGFKVVKLSTAFNLCKDVNDMGYVIAELAEKENETGIMSCFSTEEFVQAMVETYFYVMTKLKKPAEEESTEK